MSTTLGDHVSEINVGSGGRFAIRELIAADAPACDLFFAQLDREDIRLRFAAPAIPPGYMRSRLERVKDGAAIAAVDAAEMIVGIADLDLLDSSVAEIGLIVRSDRKRCGIGRTLLASVIEAARRRRLSLLVGHILVENRVMLLLARAMGFRSTGRDGFLIEVRRSVA